MDIIIPCAGQSTRFPNMRPKYLLCDYLGRSMIQLAADQYLTDHTVHIVILQKHEDQYKVTSQLRSMFGTLVKVIVLEHPTSGPAETIDQALNSITVPKGDGFLVKDCDSMFEHDRLSPGNKIFVDTLDANPAIRMPGNKSYVIDNNLGVVSNIVEKKIISDTFCVGGYQFESVDIYRDAYNKVKNSRLSEIYISSIIDYLVTNGTIFSTSKVKHYLDMGTIEDWFKYNNKPTLFIDIDGTIVENQSLHGSNNYEKDAVILTNNVQILSKAKENGAQLIFTTSRPERFRTATQHLLNKLGFFDCQLLMGMHHSKRILINDFAPSNVYPSAVAINIPRNSDTLADYLKNLL